MRKTPHPILSADPIRRGDLLLQLLETRASDSARVIGTLCDAERSSRRANIGAVGA